MIVFTFIKIFLLLFTYVSYISAFPYIFFDFPSDK